MGLGLKITLGPLLLWQGRAVRARALKLPEAAGPREGREGQGAPALRLLVVGDSSAAGVGVEHLAQARGLEEVDLEAGCDGDGAAGVAGECERRVGEGRDEAAVAPVGSVDHVGAHGHRHPRLPRSELDELHPERGAGGVGRPHGAGLLQHRIGPCVLRHRSRR